jgi:excisionase family DNA binding protein
MTEERARHGDDFQKHAAQIIPLQPVEGRPYLLVADVAERLRCSTRTIHELTRTHSIPHRRLPGSRRCLFRVDELEAWEEGAPLEVKELPRGGRVVIPSLPQG